MIAMRGVVIYLAPTPLTRTPEWRITPLENSRVWDHPFLGKQWNYILLGCDVADFSVLGLGVDDFK